MACPSVKIAAGGKNALDFFADVLELEVEEDHRLASVFKIKFAINKEDDGAWAYLDDDRVKLWQGMKISVNVGNENVELIDGYVTQIKPHIDPDENKSTLEVWGMDATCLMSLEEKILDWPSKQDSDIARQIFSSYALSPTVDTTGVIHTEEISTIMQRETDIQFLKRLARRNGFECFVKGMKGYFRKPVLTSAPKLTLAAHFGDQTNLVSFDARVDALRPAKVEMHQIDPIAKEVQSAVVTSSTLKKLGRQGAHATAAPNGHVSKMFVKNAVAFNKSEMENLGGALFDESGWFVEAKGEVETSVYGAVLEARSLVPIKGVGESFSGVYYVTSVKHLIKGRRYAQRFTARRNALAPSGMMDFIGAGALGGLL
jgi:phage protein D